MSLGAGDSMNGLAAALRRVLKRLTALYRSLPGLIISDKAHVASLCPAERL